MRLLEKASWLAAWMVLIRFAWSSVSAVRLMEMLSTGFEGGGIWVEAAKVGGGWVCI